MRKLLDRTDPGGRSEVQWGGVPGEWDARRDGSRHGVRYSRMWVVPCGAGYKVPAKANIRAASSVEAS